MRVVPLGIALGLLLGGAQAARAHEPTHHKGGCGFSSPVSDGTDSPDTWWHGEVYLAVATVNEWTWTPTDEAVTAECLLVVNGAYPGTVVLSASGSGVVAKAEELSYQADPDDVVTMCDRVTIRGEAHVDCGAGTTPLVPPVLDEPTIAPVVRTVEAAACDVLAPMDGGPADQPPSFDIRSDGDVYVAGEWFVDCPPYDTSGT